MYGFQYTTPTLPTRAMYDWEPYLDTEEQMLLGSSLQRQNMGMISVYVWQIAMKMVKISEVL
jgi:hypothetical protein